MHEVIHIIHINMDKISGLHRFFTEQMFWTGMPKNNFFKKNSDRKIGKKIEIF